MAAFRLPKEVQGWVAQLAGPLHQRLAWRLSIMVLGLLFATGRRTVASWLRGAQVGKDYRAYYYFLGAVGRKCEWIGCRLLRLVWDRLSSRPLYEVVALDDSPTKRYGPHVEGAGIHHNPTPGPAQQQFLYGHVWVTLAWVVHHPLWGVLGLPLRALVYMREKDVAKLTKWYPDLKFQTKLELAAELVRWLVDGLKRTGKKLWLVMDGAYAKRVLVKQVLAYGVTVISRLRKDAALRSLPEPPRRGQPSPRGPKPTYGKKGISLAKRAAQPGGWQTGEFELYGQKQCKTYKTFLATYAVVGGMIRVVLVKERHDWLALFCTDPEATVEQILEAYAERAAIEQDFHDLKEVHGAGQVQLRNLWANLGAFNLTLWLHTLVELWAWDQPAGRLRARRRFSPWDQADRRPSHGDRCNALRHQCVRQRITRLQGSRPMKGAIHDVLRGLLRMVL
jgi:DDE superfamily endonuclease